MDEIRLKRMARDLDCGRLIGNIYFLAKEQGKKISDLEKDVGVSTGYWSRFRGGEISSMPKLEYVAAIALLLGVTIDDLIYLDFTAMPKDERYLLKVTERLRAKTEADEQLWHAETFDEIQERIKEAYQEVEGAPDGKAELFDELDPHPLLETTVRRDPETRKIVSITNRYPPAAAGCEEAEISGNIYWTDVNADSRNYVARMYLVKSIVTKSAKEDSPDPPEGKPAYDMYLCLDGQTRRLVCSTLTVRPELQGKLAGLYQDAAASLSRIHVDEDVRDVLDVFLGEKPDDSDELPF